jgi:hypothetical protein
MNQALGLQSETGVPISAVLFEIGRIASRTSSVDAFPNRVGLIWLVENGYVVNHDLSPDGYELMAAIGRVLTERSNFGYL